MINDKTVLEQDTVDIYIVFRDSEAFMIYKDKKVNVTKYRLTPSNT